MDDLIRRIISEGVKETILSEPVLDGLSRPLVIRYTSSEGTALEKWTYPAGSAMTRSWGAIESVTYEFVGDNEMISVINDRRFGNDMINRYLMENRALNLSPQQSLQQLQKFGAVKALLEVGAISAAIAVLSQIEPDDVLTAERKQKFLDGMTKYISPT